MPEDEKGKEAAAVLTPEEEAAVEARAKEIASHALDESTRDLLGTIIKDEITQAVKIEADKRPLVSGVKDRLEADPGRGYSLLAEFLRDVFKAGRGGRGASEKLLKAQAIGLKTAGHMEEGDEAQGGYLVPTLFSARLLEKAQLTSPIWQRTTKIPIATNSLDIPAVAESSRADGSRSGGIQLYWKGEAAQKYPSKPTTEKVNLKLKKLIGLVYASDELLEDSPISIEPLITRLFSKEFDYVLQNACVNGTGGGQPLGILNALATIVHPRATAGQVNYADICGMYARLHGPSWNDAIWLISQDVLPQLFQMAMAVGTGGSAVYLPASGAAGRPYNTIFGLPMFPAESCPTLGTQGDVILADWGEYLIGQKARGLRVDTSIHVNFIYDETCFRFVYRVDGQPWWSGQLTPANGGPTQSPFVVLGDFVPTTTTTTTTGA